MHPFFRAYIRPAVLVVLIALGTVLPGQATAAKSRDVLRKIVTLCLDVNAPDYCGSCPAPRIESACARGLGCTETTDVWQETQEFVVIRDIKMCGCPKGFVHGLVIPRALIPGIEASALLPKTIWNLAWNTARSRIDDPAAIALVVNPPGALRSQDQLHVHIVRLRIGARQRLEKGAARVRSLDDVWSAATEMAKRDNLEAYGVLVMRGPEEDFFVVIDKENLEKKYTQFECR